MVIGRLFKLLKKKKPKTNKKGKITKSKSIKKRTQKKKSVKKKTISRRKIEKKEKLVGEAVHYFSKISVGVFKLKGPLKINDKIHVKGYTTNFKQVVASLQINHNPINEAKKGQEIGLRVKGKVRRGDKIYKV